MREEYTAIDFEKADKFRCPCPTGNDFCAGPYCMAWIIQRDDSGNITNKGRCGMIRSFLQIPMIPYTPFGATDMTEE